MKTLLHHTVLCHDFISDWIKEGDLAECVSHCGLDGYTWSTRQPGAPARPTYLFTYGSLLSDGISKILPQIEQAYQNGIQAIAFTDTSYLAYNREGPYDPNAQALTGEDRKRLFEYLAELDTLSRDLGVRLTYRPHLGTSLHNLEDIEELTNRLDWPLAVDTGHLVFLKMFSLEKWLETNRDRISTLIFQDYNPCAWVAARQNSEPLNQALATGVFKAPANLGIKLKALAPALDRIDYLILSAERKPDCETIPSLKSASALLKSWPN